MFVIEDLHSLGRGTGGELFGLLADRLLAMTGVFVSTRGAFEMSDNDLWVIHDFVTRLLDAIAEIKIFPIPEIISIPPA